MTQITRFINSCLFADLPEKLLQRKIELCQNVTTTYECVDPGRANQLTNVIFELNCAKIIEMKIKFNRNLINKNDAMVCTVEVNWNFTLICLFVFFFITYFSSIDGDRSMFAADKELLWCVNSRNRK